MSVVAVILQIMGITIGMIILGMVLNRVLGLTKEKISEFREKALNIQERMRNAQAVGDVQMMTRTQQDTMQFTKQIMIKQFVPLCVRCVIFIGIFALIGFFYADYTSGLLPFNLLFLGNGWVAWYFIFSISFSLIIYGFKRLYRKVTGKGISTQAKLREVMEIVSPTQRTTGVAFQVPGTTLPTPPDTLEEDTDSWKERIER
ncbi:MAG: hypothetical protein ACFFE4_04815 [Candidatus Thorarchaeota archaeon]